jgi:aerobic carbon-monoxide dehydrogenase medium subunit
VRLHPFRLVEPESLPEAIDALGRLDGETRLVAGGTALVAMIRLGLVKPDHLISLHRVAALSQIRIENGALELGAMATHADIERSRIVRDGWPLLAEAVRRVATPAIRASGTIGGNLAYAEAASDPAPALLCLNAEVGVVGALRGRPAPPSRFF